MTSHARSTPAGASRRPSDTPPDARCPRCGYDQRGEIQSWKDASPLQGVCTECGLKFEWAELLSPHRRPPPWMFEFASGAKQLAYAFPATILAVLVPWFFWRQQRMSFVITWRRIVLMLAMIAALEYLMFAISSASVAAFIWHQCQPSPRVPVSSGRMRVLSSYPETVSRGLFLPYSRQYIVRISQGGMAYGVAPQPWFERLWTVQEEEKAYLGLFAILLPVVFIALPVSRRRARVRWEHIGRIFAYSLIIPALLLAFFIWQARAGYLDPGTFTFRPQWEYIDRCHWALIVAFPLMGVFWGVAIGRYLRMDEAWKVGLSVAGLAFMLATVVMYLYEPPLVESLISRILFPFG